MAIVTAGSQHAGVKGTGTSNVAGITHPYAVYFFFTFRFFPPDFAIMCVCLAFVGPSVVCYVVMVDVDWSICRFDSMCALISERAA